MHIDHHSVSKLVVATATEELLPRFTRVKRGEKADGSVITEADLITQQRIQDSLQVSYPDIDFLGEEMPASRQEELLASGHPLWILDPLDGTSNFAAGIPHFSVSLALLDEGRVQLGIVYDPVRQECFTAEAGQGALLNGKPLTKPSVDIPLQKTTALIDYKRLPVELSVRLVTEKPYSSQRSFGSVALDWCWMAMGRSHIYLHGRSNIWDYAAGHLIFRENGGYSTTLDGGEFFVNSLSSRAAVGALDKALFEQWTEWLGIRIDN